jgi:predicted nucleic acid-binding protein
MYLDSSVIVKLVAPEPDSQVYAEMVSHQPVGVSILAWTEVSSALLGRVRSGKLQEQDRRMAWNKFQVFVDEQTLEIYDLDNVICKKAQQILQICHPHVALRTLDALHLATCDRSQDFPLVTDDIRMKSAALHLGIPLHE